VEICRKFGWEVLTAGQVAKRAGIPRQSVLSGQNSDVYHWNGRYKIILQEPYYILADEVAIVHYF
jgi:hypothetical protein